jgi:ATP-dependent Lon protease
MARDTQTKLSKREQIIRSKKQEENNKRKKKVENSDSDDNIESESDSDEMDVHEYRKMISKIFPSKHINKKIQSGEKLKKVIQRLNEEEEDEDEEEEEIKPKKGKVAKKSKKQHHYDDVSESEEEEEEVEKVTKKSKKTNKKNKKNKKVEVSDDEDEEWVTASEDEDDEDEDSELLEKPSKGKLNIIFTIGGSGEEEDEWDDEDDSDYEEDDEISTEDEDVEVSTDDSSSDEDSEDYESEEESEEEEPPPKKRKNSKKSSTKEENKVIEEIDTNNAMKSNETLVQLKKLMESNPNDKSIQKCIEVYQDDLKMQKVKVEKKQKKQKAKNMRIFRKIIKDKNTLNDFTFYEKLDTENQKKIIKELRDINKITRIEKPYRITLLESTIPVQFKAAAMKKINSLRYMEPGSGEFYKIKNWVDTFMRIPFNKNEGLPISIDDGVEKCHEFMENAQKTLDEAVYGLNDAKMQIMQMLGQLLTNPKAIGTAIAIHGPPGTGKTSLVKEGISKILNRPFAFIALGGATDSSFLEGHGYTYEGSTWGKIVQILIDSKCMNPVIYFDELDKISDTPRGEEIAGILTHLTDTTQNSQFHDKYFAEINFDLSKCLFIFSYNDENKVNAILKDRMYRIKTKGYISKEKTIIANNYLIPKIQEQVRFASSEIQIPNDVIAHMIDTHCNKEDGVRNLKRCLEIIYTKLNLYRLMKPGTNLFEGEMSLKVEFPFKVTKEIVDKLIKKESDGLETWRNLYV